MRRQSACPAPPSPAVTAGQRRLAEEAVQHIFAVAPGCAPDYAVHRHRNAFDEAYRAADREPWRKTEAREWEATHIEGCPV